MSWKPSAPFITPLKLLSPTTTKTAGVSKKTYARDGPVFFCSFKTYGGTERETNGTIAVEDTATIETTFRPDITADCAVLNTVNGQIYEIIGEPENIEARSRFLRFKVRGLKGGA